jgi:ankyrin repeat protein
MATRAGPMRLLMALLMISTAHATATPSLHELARSGDAAGLTAALQAAPTGVNDNDSYGWTPLFWAVDGGHVDAVRAPALAWPSPARPKPHATSLAGHGAASPSNRTTKTE